MKISRIDFGWVSRPTARVAPTTYHSTDTNRGQFGFSAKGGTYVEPFLAFGFVSPRTCGNGDRPNPRHFDRFEHCDRVSAIESIPIPVHKNLAFHSTRSKLSLQKQSYDIAVTWTATTQCRHCRLPLSRPERKMGR
jgi:hypothetical protein